MFVDTRLGGKPRWYVTPPEDYNMRVPDEIRDCVVFLGIRVMREGGHLEDIWGGTAFFVAIPSETRPDAAYVYLVTAKHVVTALQQAQAPILRINQVNREALVIGLGNTTWYFHPTQEEVDVAVMPFGPSQEQFDYLIYPQEGFLTDGAVEEMGIGIGDEVFMTGLFAHLSGKARNIPIVRMGNIAMMPTDTVPTKAGEIEAYLIEARSIGGLSGSPAFVRRTSVTYAKIESIPHYLLGLVQGHWELEAADTKDEAMIADFKDANGIVNMGIAIVVPAKKISEVLNQPMLRESRANQDKAIREKNLPVMDSGFPEEGGHKTPAKPVSLYPMDEEEALKRLLRVPPPEKGKQ